MSGRSLSTGWASSGPLDLAQAGERPRAGWQAGVPEPLLFSFPPPLPAPAPSRAPWLGPWTARPPSDGALAEKRCPCPAQLYLLEVSDLGSRAPPALHLLLLFSVPFTVPRTHVVRPIVPPVLRWGDGGEALVIKQLDFCSQSDSVFMSLLEVREGLPSALCPRLDRPGYYREGPGHDQSSLGVQGCQREGRRRGSGLGPCP